MKEFAMYRGDEFIAIGTFKELGEFVGLKESTIRYYQSNCYSKRYKNEEDKYKFVRVDQYSEE